MIRLSENLTPNATVWLTLFAVFTLAPALRVVAEETRVVFENDVVPILKTRCIRCHGAQKREGGLDLRRRFTIQEGGDSGPAIVVGKPDQSLLIRLIADGDMPPNGEPDLTDQENRVIQRWVASGALTAAATEEPLPHADDPSGIEPSARRHWAFQPIRRPAVPDVESPWIRTPIDAFVVSRLQEQGWTPGPPASPRDLIRRVSFDLTGLPPAPEQIESFVRDSSPAAWSDLVDRLLASDHYGERWAQHWLDVVRYAETEGFEYDRHLPDAWRYRDYVIDSLNSDKPFDQFVREQIAGDELNPADHEFQAAAILHRLGAVRRNAGNPDIALSRNEVLTERTNIIGEAFLGLTVGCARCHNHKLEPILQKDYYRLQAYFAASSEHNIVMAPPGEQARWKKQTDSINGTISELKKRLADADDAEVPDLERRIRQLNDSLPPHLPTVPGIRNDFSSLTEIHVLRRGLREHRGAKVGPRPLSVLVPESEPELATDVDRPRTRLAEWLTHPNHPLTARVIVNRIWQQHFGIGLVKTANDFGTRGDPPSHPELLDWLAAELIDNGWRFKPLHRLIAQSATYRQSTSRPTVDDPVLADPDNRFLSRFSRRRLSGEEIRDAMLFVAGRLNTKMHGPSVMIPVDEELVALLYKPDQWRVTNDISEHNRRSVYLIAKRNLRLPFMETFDAPTLQTSCPTRQSSTHAPQVLELLNGEFAGAMSSAFAERLRRECGDDPERTVDRAWRLAIGRPPSDLEERLAIRFVEAEPLEEFALAVFNLSDFIYVK